MSEEIKIGRRHFLSTAGVSIAAGQFGIIGSAVAQSSKAKPATVPAIKGGTNKSFTSLKQIDAGLLNVGYAELGPIDGPTAILLHGWPYDIHSSATARRGFCRMIPYGTASHRHSLLISFTSWTLSKFRRPSSAGFDWGARTADIIAVLWPERCKGLVFRERLSDR